MRDNARRAMVKDLLEKGWKRNEITEAVPCSKAMVTSVAKEINHVWGASAMEAAQRAVATYTAARRKQQIKEVAESFDHIKNRLEEKCVVFAFGGRDNVYRDKELEAPDARSARDLSTTMVNLVRVMKELSTFDTGDEDTSAIAEYLKIAKGEQEPNAGSTDS